MSQSSRIVAFLVLTFIVFITSRGELGAYLGFFGIGSSAKVKAVPVTGGSGSVIGSTLNPLAANASEGTIPGGSVLLPLASSALGF